MRHLVAYSCNFDQVQQELGQPGQTFKLNNFLQSCIFYMFLVNFRSIPLVHCKCKLSYPTLMNKSRNI